MAAGDKNSVQGGNPQEPIAAYEDSAADRVTAVLPTDSLGAPITTTNPLTTSPPVAGEATGTLTASGQAATLAMPNGAGGVHVFLSGTFTSTSAVTFEGSYDGGSTWIAVIMTYRQGAAPNLTTTTTGTLFGLGISAFIGDGTGFTHFRVRCSTYQGSDSIGVRIRSSMEPTAVTAVAYFPVNGSIAAGSAASQAPVYVGGSDGTNIRQSFLSTKAAAPGGTPYYLAVQQPKDSGRTALTYTATAAAAGTTTTETLITLTKSSGTSATSTGTSFVVTNGKRFRIVSLMVATRGHSTATAQTTTFNLRINTGGAVTTTSTPIIFSARSATAAVASDWDRATFDLGGDGYEILGDGTLQFGITAAATYTTNAPTWDVAIIGHEY